MYGTYGATLCVLLTKNPWRGERGPELFKAKVPLCVMAGPGLESTFLRPSAALFLHTPIPYLKLNQIHPGAKDRQTFLPRVVWLK